MKEWRERNAMFERELKAAMSRLTIQKQLRSMGHKPPCGASMTLLRALRRIQSVHSYGSVTRQASESIKSLSS